MLKNDEKRRPGDSIRTNPTLADGLYRFPGSL